MEQLVKQAILFCFSLFANAAFSFGGAAMLKAVVTVNLARVNVTVTNGSSEFRVRDFHGKILPQ